jgi:hypothetical protein
MVMLEEGPTLLAVGSVISHWYVSCRMFGAIVLSLFRSARSSGYKGLGVPNSAPSIRIGPPPRSMLNAPGAIWYASEFAVMTEALAGEARMSPM